MPRSHITVCPSCTGDGHLPLSYSSLRAVSCPTCRGLGTVLVCPGCESVCREGSRDGLAVERSGQCCSCVDYDAATACPDCAEGRANYGATRCYECQEAINARLAREHRALIAANPELA